MAPTPTSIDECQTQTYHTLRNNGIVPLVDRGLVLATCAGHRADQEYQARLAYYITTCIVASPRPRFLSLTLTDTESMSITLDRTLLDMFPKLGRDILLMDEETVVPITLDLRRLPDESAGIVCGVAGRLISRMTSKAGRGFDMSYLSTAKAGSVIVHEDEVDDALDALELLRQSPDPEAAVLDE